VTILYFLLNRYKLKLIKNVNNSLEGKMKFTTMTPLLIALVAPVLVFGCMSANQHYQQTHGPKEKEMTVGTVQKEIRKGMSAADVATVLGSPNIVTTDSDNREVWVYDKISTDVSYSKDSSGAGLKLLIAGVSDSLFGSGLGSGNYSRSAGAQSRTQRTLTVVIKYTEQKLVRDFFYHTSRF
jgi:outer membrane protein assembly factor BamE (lipoprotein component of BamABCDE complex)